MFFRARDLHYRGRGAVTVWSHPSEKKGCNVYIDQKTNQATVFEVWLSRGIK